MPKVFWVIKKQIPNALTCANLLWGCIGTALVFQDSAQVAAWCIYIAAFFDFADGWVARWLQVSSPLGKQLDSLADVISFGLLPGMILFQLIHQNQPTSWAYLSFSIPIFSALRLARFNIDLRQTKGFIGLPTPANALFISGLPFAGELFPPLVSSASLLIIAVSLSVLMVANFPLMAFKFDGWSWQQYRFQYLMLLVAAVLLFAFKFAAMPLVVVLYVVLSIVQNIAA
ncbi:MAG: CDP-diacylglycerol--serine O-phosphatidyltransferase [Cytophagales bacterium]|nr:CDP-diacylglycerol--serine O-phosphatidyltransferase [Bernardetiaceae bacterium]MDW8209948.1 CDP-diacylglycerol--serine O-phosphatidyltransferase [Cytophagales bacterium]